ncbi:MAG: DUF3305 domain-containing protein [Granulosicoccus sp.]
MSGDTPNLPDGASDDRLFNGQDIATRLLIPATVILERRTISRSFWSLPSWYLHTVAIGEHLVTGHALSGGKGMVAGQSDKGDLFAWSGFEVALYKDACERYWHALIGDKPLVYVICRDEADDIDSSDTDTFSLQPAVVTVDYDDASAAAETDSPVLSAPIPSELYRYMERFVLTHYQPQEFKKRKRRNWSDEQGSHSGRKGPGNTGGGLKGINHE